MTKWLSPLEMINWNFQGGMDFNSFVNGIMYTYASITLYREPHSLLWMSSCRNISDQMVSSSHSCNLQRLSDNINKHIWSLRFGVHLTLLYLELLSYLLWGYNSCNISIVAISREVYNQGVFNKINYSKLPATIYWISYLTDLNFCCQLINVSQSSVLPYWYHVSIRQ